MKWKRIVLMCWGISAPPQWNPGAINQWFLVEQMIVARHFCISIFLYFHCERYPLVCSFQVGTLSTDGDLRETYHFFNLSKVQLEFLIPTEKGHQFWSSECWFSLDFVWITLRPKVVDFHLDTFSAAQGALLHQFGGFKVWLPWATQRPSIAMCDWV